jgi:predicted nucleic-acid-binding protein
MLAIDTNIVVRCVVGDGGNEFRRALDLVENNQVSVWLTVVLETEWVLRDAYEFPRGDVLSAFEGLFGLPNVSVTDPQAMRKAITLAESGLDFAEAIHLAQAAGTETFVTFDKDLVKRASRNGVSVGLG